MHNEVSLSYDCSYAQYGFSVHQFPTMTLATSIRGTPDNDASNGKEGWR